MKNNFKTLILLAGLGGLMVGIGSLWGRNGAVLGLVIAGVMNLGAYWFSDKLALKMSGAQPVTPSEAPQLYDIVANLTQRASMPMPRLYVIPSEQPNAFATGRNPQKSAVAVTQGIVNVLTRDELEGVIAHELAHIRNRDILIASVAATIAAAVGFIARMAQWSMFMGGSDDEEGGGNIIGVLVAAIVAPLAAVVIQLAISRSREFHADHTGAVISGRPESLASALEKIDRYAHAMPMPVNPAAAPLFIINPLSGVGRGMVKLFSTHPPTEERIRRLEELYGRV